MCASKHNFRNWNMTNFVHIKAKRLHWVQISSFWILNATSEPESVHGFVFGLFGPSTLCVQLHFFLAYIRLLLKFFHVSSWGQVVLLVCMGHYALFRWVVPFHDVSRSPSLDNLEERVRVYHCIIA